MVPLYDYKLGLPNTFFPTLNTKVPDATVRQNAAENILLDLVNCFGLIRTERHLQDEPQLSETVSGKDSNRLKNWLKSLSESRGPRYELFERIRNAIKNVPFGYGEIRPISEDGKVDVLVIDEARELLIERHGTGIQQVLYLLSRFEKKEAKIIGVEEFELNLSPSLQNKALNYIKSKIGNSPTDYCSQLFITSHSMHLSKRNDTVVFATELPPGGEGGTIVKRGPEAVANLKSHFDYGLIKLPNSPRWRA